MSDHLPECRVRTYTTDDGMVYEVAGDLCICPALHACEQRVREEYVPEVGRGWGEYLAYKTGIDNGYAAGVQAARDAVADADCWYATSAAVQVAGSDVKYVVQADALAAIDALGGSDD